MNFLTNRANNIWFYNHLSGIGKFLYTLHPMLPPYLLNLKKHITLTGEEKEIAYQCLFEKITEEEWKELINIILETGDMWRFREHFGFGIHVRNLLRKIDINLDEVFLENYWPDIIEEAIIRKYYWVYLVLP